MDHHDVEKLLYSRRDTAEALSLSVRSVDYLITTRRLPTRRIGGKILIPASAVRRFAREDHPEFVRCPKRCASNPGRKPPVSASSSDYPERPPETMTGTQRMR
jgi:Helix-turn-helix domain